MNLQKKKIHVKALANTPYLISIDEVIGKGSYGTVMRAFSKDEPSKELVVKIINVEQENKQSILAELKMLKRIPSHQNLVNHLKVQVHSENKFYLFMDFCNGGTFQKYINSNPNCSQEIVWRFLRQFCAGYKVLYDAHIVHRDIKPQNILIHKGKFKIADFGLSRKIYHHSLEQNLSIKGTPLYMAPEIELKNEGCSKIDIFSLGIVLYRLAYNGSFPFYDHNSGIVSIHQYFEQMKTIELKFPRYPRRSKQFENLIRRMLEKDPNDRIDWKQIFILLDEESKQEDKEKLTKQVEKIQEIREQQDEVKEKEKCQVPEDFQILRNSIEEISKSAVTIKFIIQPFNHQLNSQIQTQRLIEFTQIFTNSQITAFQTYVMRKKIIIQLIHHLQKILQAFLITLSPSTKVKKYLKHQIQTIQTQFLIYINHALSQLKTLFNNYSKGISQQKLKFLFENIDKDEQTNLGKLQKHKIDKIQFQQLKLQTILYDFLTEFMDFQKNIKQELKTSALLMLDIYDGLLKIQSMAYINSEGMVELVEIQFQDAELDKIDYKNLSSYTKYLEEINQTTLAKVQESLSKMGLIIL